MVGSCTVQLSQSVLCPRSSTSPQILIKSRQRAALSAVQNSGSSTRREERGGAFILFIALYRAKYLDLFSPTYWFSLSILKKHVLSMCTHTQHTVCCALDRQMGRLVSQVGIKGVCRNVRAYQSPAHSSSAH